MKNKEETAIVWLSFAFLPAEFLAPLARALLRILDLPLSSSSSGFLQRTTGCYLTQNNMRNGIPQNEISRTGARKTFPLPGCRKEQEQSSGCACFFFVQSSPLCLKTFPLWFCDRKERRRCRAAGLCAPLPSDCVFSVYVGSVWESSPSASPLPCTLFKGQTTRTSARKHFRLSATK